MYTKLAENSIVNTLWDHIKILQNEKTLLQSEKNRKWGQKFQEKHPILSRLY